MRWQPKVPWGPTLMSNGQPRTVRTLADPKNPN
jgi:hypothetical protein